MQHTKESACIFHSSTESLDIIKVFIYQPMLKSFVLKEMLKFTLKMLQHVSV
jgi:hypothetical protein